MAEKTTDLARRTERGLASRESLFEPFRMMDRFVDEMDRVFDDVFGGTLPAHRFGRSWLRPQSADAGMWAPAVEVFHRNHELVVRAELPGLTRNDVKVDVTDDHITLQGERKHEHEEEKEGVFHSERSYGSFYRHIPLPAGTITDQAKATFKNGVLEITMPAPPEQVRRGRRLEVTEGSSK
ncbi:MAG TPA: Hsp20/alpha crystallin family protein [Vicinamibacterales bacterium]